MYNRVVQIDDLTRILIYIPCHKDYDLALSNVNKISKQLTNLQIPSSTFSIDVLVSVNDAKVNVIEDKNLDKIEFSEDLGADLNINLGFVKALERQVDYLWILSANEILKDDAIKNLVDLIQANSQYDLLVTNADNRKGMIEISNIYDLPSKLSLGLISGVIYKTLNTKKFFSLGLKYNFTGWGHLAVVQGCIDGLPKFHIYEFPDSQLFEKPVTKLYETDLNIYEYVKQAYRHSFYGEIILMPIVFGFDKSRIRKFIRLWFRRNWFRIGFYYNKKALHENEMNDVTNWSYRVFLYIIRNYNFLVYFLILILRWIDFDFVNKSSKVKHLLKGIFK